ncbi:MAG TPA: maleylpyruvate isomerase family mycothiol-dependent enzyme [Acidimicrobiales bacterium]
MAELVPAGRLDYPTIFAEERSELLDFLSALPAEDWAAPTECPAWSVKGIVLHLLGDDLSILSRQRDGEPSLVAIEAGSNWDEFFVALDRHNESWVSAARFFSLPLIINLLRGSGEDTYAFYNVVDPDLLGEPIPWIGPEPAPYSLLCAREYLERWIHQCQIRRAVGRGEWFDERWVHPAVAVAVRGFPLGFAALSAAEGTTVAVVLSGGPAWTVRNEAAGWRLCDGLPPDPTVALTMDTATAARLFSRALTRAQIADLKFAGDESLCQSFAIGLAAFFGR